MKSKRWIDKKIQIVRYSSVTCGFGSSAILLVISWIFPLEIFPLKWPWLALGICVTALISFLPNLMIVLNKGWGKAATHVYSGLVVFGCSTNWLYFSLNVYPKSTPLEGGIYTVIMAGIVSCLVLTMMHSLAMTLTAISIAMLPFIFSNFFMHNHFGTIMGFLSVVYFLCALGQAFFLHYLLKKEFLLTEKNQKLLEENKKKTEELVHASKLASLGKMAGGVAHEINNPLAIINGYALELRHRLLKNKDFDQNTERILQAIHSNVKRISNITKDLRLISDGESHIYFQECDLNRIVENALLLIKSDCDRLGIEVRLQLPEPPTLVKCQEASISQVIYEVFQNSCEAIKDLPEKWIEVSVNLLQEGLCLSVVDSGESISPEISRSIMDPFFTTKDIGEGMGLGLSIASGIMRRHNGTLKFDQRSKNTKFDIIFASPEQKGHFRDSKELENERVPDRRT